MRNDLADVTLIIDRSGSMSSMQIEAQNGINHFIEEQKKLPGECNFSLVQFDNEYEVVINNTPIQDVSSYQLKPRGATALFDAIGKTINTIGQRLSNMKEEDRPGLVTVMIVTDGHENSSQEFKREKIKEMIELQQGTYNWKFIFLGANQDSFLSGGALGISASGIANYDNQGVFKAFSGTVNNVSRMRSATMDCMPVVCAYTDEERTSMLGDKNAQS